MAQYMNYTSKKAVIKKKRKVQNHPPQELRSYSLFRKAPHTISNVVERNRNLSANWNTSRAVYGTGNLIATK